MKNKYSNEECIFKQKISSIEDYLGSNGNTQFEYSIIKQAPSLQPITLVLQFFSRRDCDNKVMIQINGITADQIGTVIDILEEAEGVMGQYEQSKTNHSI